MPSSNMLTRQLLVSLKHPTQRANPPTAHAKHDPTLLVPERANPPTAHAEHAIQSANPPTAHAEHPAPHTNLLSFLAPMTHHHAVFHENSV
jgi:hypothetical protein